MKIFSIRRIQKIIPAYKGFYTDEMIFNEWLAGYIETKIYRCFLNKPYKLLHHYRMKDGIPIYGYKERTCNRDLPEYRKQTIVGYKLKFVKIKI